MKLKIVCLLIFLGVIYLSLKGLFFKCSFFRGAEELTFD